MELTECLREKTATELRGQWRSQMEFGNEGEDYQIFEDERE
jgi:hypothetical protein